MTYYVEAYERAKVLKLEYDQKFGRWLSLSENGTDRKELLVSFKEARGALDRLDSASQELAKIMSKMARIPDDFVVRVLT